MSKATAISIDKGFDSLNFLANRTPISTSAEKSKSFCRLSDYRDGGIFLAYYAGNSDWERHSNGDEIVMVFEGETTLFLFSDNKETPNHLSAGELFVVPINTWHRFESPDGVKVMTVTPQPTDHRVDTPDA